MTAGYRSELPSSAIAATFSSHGEWITGFTINGERYGGAYDPVQDYRARRFVEWMHRHSPGAGTILECGCLEGGHTALLAQELPGKTIHGVDVRTDNLAKTKAVTDLVGSKNVSLSQLDLDDPALQFSQSYDAIFCVGLLYHLRSPREFIRRAAASSPVLWLWTVYCSEHEVAQAEEASRGRILVESTEHPLSAIRRESYLPTLGSLAEFLWEAGYTRVDLLNKEMTANGNGPAILLCATR